MNGQSVGGMARVMFDPGAGPDVGVVSGVELQAAGRARREGLIVDTAPFPWSLDEYRTIVVGQVVGEVSGRVLDQIEQLWRQAVPPEHASGALYDGRDD